MTEVAISADMLTVTPGDDVWRGIASLLDDYAKVKPEDLVVILYTIDAKEPAAWVVAELTARGHCPLTLGMNPLQDETVEHRLREILPDPATESRITMITIERDTMSHFLQLRRALAPYPESNWTVLRIINASEQFFKSMLNVTPEILSAVNGALLTRLIPARQLSISGPNGTDLDISLDSHRYRWLSNRGVRRDGSFLILPAGEVSTFPANINGVFVADGAFNVTAYTAADVRLENHPVTVEIKDGRMVDFSCDDKKIKRLIRRCLKFENGDRVGELGFGTNLGTHGFISMNSHINERHPGVHLGFGQHGQTLAVAKYLCDIHLDLITPDATIRIDGGETIHTGELGRYREHAHPDVLLAGIDEEDIDGDCCGIIPMETEKAKNEYWRLKDCR